MTSSWLFIFEEWCKCTLKKYWAKKTFGLASWRSLAKRAGSGARSGSVNQRCGSADPDPYNMSRIRNTCSNALWLTIIVVDPYWLPRTENYVPCVVGNIILHAQFLQWMAPFLDFCNIPSSHSLNKLFLNLKTQSHDFFYSLKVFKFRNRCKTAFGMLWYYLIINFLFASTKSVLSSQWLQEISTKYPCHRRLCI